MNIKYVGTFEALKQKLSTLNGEWEENHNNKKVFRLNGGVLNWFESTGTLSFQGRSPGLQQLNSVVPNLLYPNEFSQIENQLAIETTNPVVTKDSPTQKSLESLYLEGSFSTSEIIIGIVNAVGTEYKRVIDPLVDRLRGFNYKVEEIRISSLLEITSIESHKEYDRIKNYMNAGNELRKSRGNNAILAAGAAFKIREKRAEKTEKIAYIINSLKHPDEVNFLRKIYGNGFYLFGIHADERRRHEYLVNDKSLNQTEASELIKIDEDENIEHGQKTRDTFHLSDFFISLGKNDDQVKHTLQRFLDLIFSNPFKNPTFDEFAMFMAFNSSIRSSDLSRQVGAIISKHQQIIATGANDTPKSGGGQYWATTNPDTGEVTDEDAGKDHMRDQDSNKAAQQEMIIEIANAMIENGMIESSRKADLEGILSKSKISDLTEFGRVVHAEMEAILSCSRIGISTVEATLYCTTFPCHNCAKHIVDAGISRVVYVEPYPKSRALDLHSDSISLKTSLDISEKSTLVVFEPFTGVGARRFLELFSMNLGNGFKLKRKDKNGNAVDWHKATAVVRTPLLPKSYLDVELAASSAWKSD